MITDDSGQQYESQSHFILGLPINKEKNKDTGSESSSTTPKGATEKPTDASEVDRGHNVPLIASALTKDGSSMYGMAIDHRVSTDMEFDGRTHDITPFLQAHEQAELPVMSDLIKNGATPKDAYEQAHDKVANPTEAAARYAYAAKNNLDPDEFNKAYYQHIAKQMDIASQPSDQPRHPDAHTTRYGLDPGTKVAMDLQDNDPNKAHSQFDMPGGFGGGGGGGFRSTRAIKPDVMPAANENKPNVLEGQNLNTVPTEELKARFEELRDRLLGPKSRGTIPKEVMTSLKGLDHLGFDRPSDALNAIRDDIKRGVDPKKNWDIHPEDELMWKRIMDHINKPGKKGATFRRGTSGEAIPLTPENIDRVYGKEENIIKFPGAEPKPATDQLREWFNPDK